MNQNPIDEVDDNSDKSDPQAIKNQEPSATPNIEDLNVLKRRSSSLSDSQTRQRRKVEALLEEDDKDIELQRLNDMKNNNTTKISNKNNSPILIKEIEHKSLSDFRENLFDKEDQNIDSRNFSGNNSSVSLLVSSDGSDFSSDSKDHLKDDIFLEDISHNNASQNDIASIIDDNENNNNSSVSEDSQPVITHAIKKTPKKLSKASKSLSKPSQTKSKIAKKNATSDTPLNTSSEFVTKIDSFLDSVKIPLKKGVSEAKQRSKKLESLNKQIEEYENNDKLRNEMNRKYIKFIELKAKRISNIQPNSSSLTNDNNNDNKRKYVMYVTESELKIIRKNIKLLIDLGAMLFWDHKYDSFKNDAMNERKIEFQISGNSTQVEKGKEAIIYLLNYERKIEKEQAVMIEIDMWVPKILIRKIVGYHEKNIIEYYKKYDVSIKFDSGLINDEFYAIHEQTMITIKGKKAYAEIVSIDINSKISSLVVRTVHLAPSD